MKKNYLLAAILCLITTAAAAQQTEQVQIPNIPLASKWLYDNNGDGKLEFINPETNLSLATAKWTTIQLLTSNLKKENDEITSQHTAFVVSANYVGFVKIR